MSDNIEDPAPDQPAEGRGHTVEITVNGKPRTIPWGFKNAMTESRAAKKLGVEYPGTAKKGE